MKTSRMSRRRQNLGYLVGLVLGGIVLLGLLLSGREGLHALGPMNTGHEEFQCTSCHKSAPGTRRQQLQANVRYWLGLRETSLSFGHKDVTNEACLECHERPNDRHPVFRFFEPRFAEARLAIQPQYCVSCHTEHRGKRVTIDEIGFCVNCHEDTELKNDSLDISHVRLIDQASWDTCLGCHDFHENHIMETKTVVKERLTTDQIVSYFQGGPSPYSKKKHYKAKKETTDGQ